MPIDGLHCLCYTVIMSMKHGRYYTIALYGINRFDVRVDMCK